MNNFNIKKISMSLVVASLVSSTAFANSDTSDALIEKTESAISVIEIVGSSIPTFSELVKQYDADNNETLNVQELVENAKLTEAFYVVDVNADNEINSDEYNQYVESLKVKV